MNRQRDVVGEKRGPKEMRISEYACVMRRKGHVWLIVIKIAKPEVVRDERTPRACSSVSCEN